MSSLLFAQAGEPTLSIEANQITAHASPMLYGLMTEEINHAYDGGLYAELVQNRAFQDDLEKPAHWSVFPEATAAAAITLDRAQHLNEQLPVCLRLEVTQASPSAPAGLANEGYWGIPVKPHTRYQASFYARANSGFSGPVMVSIVGLDGTTVFAKAKVAGLTTEWRRYEVTLKTGQIQPTDEARLVLSVDRPAKVWFNLVSLFPPTWHGRANGLRPDLMQMLVDLKPGFLRFPGGNFLEGDTATTRFDWKQTIGPLAERPGHQGPWGYRSTDGLGLLEFLLWSEDMGAEPVLAVYAGYSLKGAYVKAGPELEPYVQDALDEIEYVSGSVSTKWGAQRAKDGHPAPFPLHYVEIGNEDWFDKSGSYDGRFTQFYDAIKAKYPLLKCISTVGNEEADKFPVHSRHPDVLDEHYYRSAAAFLEDSPKHFDKYDRKGPEIFVGEWASYEDIVPWSPPSKKLPPTPSMKSALGDAAWMTAMERYPDLIKMQCYAPLLVNVNAGARQWRPNLIGYDALRTYGSPSYYAIWMFSRHRGDEVLQATLSDSPLLFSVAKEAKAGTIIIKLVNPESQPQPVNIEIHGVRSVASKATAITLAGGESESNSIDEPAKVAPVNSKVTGVGPSFSYTLSPFSITILEVKTK